MTYPDFDFITRNVWTWQDGGRGYRLPARIMRVKQYRAKYAEYLELLLREYLYVHEEDNAFLQRMHAASRMITRPALLVRMHRSKDVQECVALMMFSQDAWHVLDYMWTYQESSKGVNETILHPYPPLPFPLPFDGIGAEGIKLFVEKRRSIAFEQLKSPPPF